MKAEIISIGTELLLGHVVNSNAAFLSRELTSLGMDVLYQVTVGNDEKQLLEAVKLAETRSDLLIFIGGMGQTEDDITKEALSKHLDTTLILHEETEDKIITYHKNSDLKMPENNQLQALILADSTPLPNDTGLSVCMVLEKNDRLYALVPGPADECEPMVENHLKPFLVKKVLEENVVHTRRLKFFGLTESQAKKHIGDYLSHETNPSVSLYSNESEMTVRLTARDKSDEAAEERLDKMEKKIMKDLSEFFYGYGEKRLADVIKDILIENELTITAAESLTGGAFLSALTSDLSAGAILEGGIVTYSTEKKHEVLKVTKKTIEKYGVVSPECAIEMAEKSMNLFGSDIGVGLTGVAGPSSMEGQIPGTVWIGIAYKDKTSFAKHFHFGYKRNNNRRLSVLHALDLVRRVIKELPIDSSINYGEDK